RKAGLIGLSARAIGALAGAAFFWALPASPFLTFDDLDADREYGVAQVDEIEFDIDPLTTASIANPFENEIFRGPNRGAKTDRYRAPANPLDIVAAFDGARQRLAELRAGAVEGATAASVALAEIPAAPQEPVIAYASLGGAEPPPSEALAAIGSISAGDLLDPSQPFPAAVPERLAYARENAPATEHQGTFMPAMAASEREHWCMAAAIYFEARGESYRGQVAVAQVVRNRVAHSLYPNTICGVVFQNQSWRNRCQFSFACDGRPERVTDPQAWAQAEEIATKMIEGELYLAEVGSATHYHANYVYPHWASRMTKVARIEHHIFYRFRNS
ncbi:MAG: cell wall hydrolase, partial [Cucumibacter sp.]